jgi:hypothetical protein
VRLRSLGKSGQDVEHGGDELSSGELPPLRVQYGSGSGNAYFAEDAAEGAEGSSSPPPDSLEMGGGGFEAGMPPMPPAAGAQLRGWDALAGRPSSVVRFAAHARSASGTQYPLQR